MKKVIRTMQVNGRVFRIEGTNSVTHDVIGANDENDIFIHYGRPSQTKIAIWSDWCRWAREAGARLEITYHNCFRFTISGYVEYCGKIYNLYITDRYNRAYEVAEE